MTTIPCERCDGRRFLRTDHGWTPCGCYWAQLSQSYIKRPIRQSQLTLPEGWMDREPWPLTDRMVTGNGAADYDAFRFMVWRSLLAYFGRRLGYDYFDAFRLVDINFERDPEYPSLRPLKELDLLVLVVGLHDPPHSYAPRLLDYMLSLRRMDGRPTWLYRTTGGGSQPPPRRDELPEGRTARQRALLGGE